MERKEQEMGEKLEVVQNVIHKTPDILEMQEVLSEKSDFLNSRTETIM